MPRVADVARVVLASVRLTMGTAGLLAPGTVIRRLHIDPSVQPGMRYPLRMFGIRTVLIAADLLRRDGPDRRRAVLLAPVVHGTDTVSAYLARSEEHTSELQSRQYLVCRLLLEKKKKKS